MYMLVDAGAVSVDRYCDDFPVSAMRVDARMGIAYIDFTDGSIYNAWAEEFTLIFE